MVILSQSLNFLSLWVFWFYDSDDDDAFFRFQEHTISPFDQDNNKNKIEFCLRFTETT